MLSERDFRRLFTTRLISQAGDGIFYTPSSGIWQTVWMEPVAAAHGSPAAHGHATGAPGHHIAAASSSSAAAAPSAPVAPNDTATLKGRTVHTQL